MAALAKKLRIVWTQVDRVGNEIMAFVLFRPVADAEFDDQSSAIINEVIVMRPALLGGFFRPELFGNFQRQFFRNNTGHITLAFE